MKRLCAVLAALLLCVPLRAMAVDVSAESAVLVDLTCGRVLYAKNADARRPIASTTKIMTALVALQTAKLEDIVVVDASSTRIEGSSLYLKPGDELTVRELLVGLMLRSGNDAAHALALHCAGSVEAFAGMMNAKAKQLGMINSHFANPHGLDDEYHYSTARDMALLTSEAMRNPEFAALVRQRSARVAGQVIHNHNRLLSLYDGAVGVKTGFTKTAGRCLVSAAERGGQTLVAVTLKASDDWDDHRGMLDYGFARYPLRTLMTGGTIVAEIPVAGGDAELVPVRLGDSLRMALREEETPQLTAAVELPPMVWAPVREGTFAGVVRFYLNGHEVAKGDLFWDADISQPEPESLWKRLFGR